MEKLDKLETYEDILVAEGEADRGEVYSRAEVNRMMKNTSQNTRPNFRRG